MSPKRSGKVWHGKVYSYSNGQRRLVGIKTVGCQTEMHVLKRQKMIKSNKRRDDDRVDETKEPTPERLVTLKKHQFTPRRKKFNDKKVTIMIILN